MEKKYRFTIITVCYNAEKTIEKTIRSLLNQTFSNYEYIIKDGGSTDNTLHIINSLVSESDLVHIISEPDQGIYDAMNHALNIAQGEYIYFLNAGDILSDADVLYAVDQAIMEKQADIIYGNVVQVSQEQRIIRRYGSSCSKKIYFLTGDCICHQAIFAARHLFEKKKFDISYCVCADKEWQLYHINQKTVFVPLKFTVAEVLTEGFSLAHVEEFENETLECIKVYCKRTKWIYLLVSNMKKNKQMLWAFRNIEKMFFLGEKSNRVE